jgi:cytochrome c oxidase subunit 3
MKKTAYLQEQPSPTLAMNPKKFALWLFIVTVIMLFGAFTSAYIVRAAEGNWLEFDLPPIFWTSSVIMLISSGTMHWAYMAAKKDELEKLKLAITITFILGIAFLVMQVKGWAALIDIGVFFGGNQSNPAGSFVYVLSFLHGLHLIGGLVVLIFALIATYNYKIHAKALLQIEMCATYWHFLDALWIYLFVFLLMNN